MTVRCIALIPRSLAAAFAVVALSGCPSTPPGNKGQSAEPPPAATVTDGFKKALAWANGICARLADAKEKGNELVLAEATKEFDAELAKLVGKEVRWTVPVSEVTATHVHFIQYRLRRNATDWTINSRFFYGEGNGSGDVVGQFAVSAFAKGRSPIEEAPAGKEGPPPTPEELRPLIQKDQGVLNRGPTLTTSLPIGNGISVEQARKLGKGSQVTLTGKVYYCVRGFETQVGRLVAVCIQDVRVTD